jgi:hypothetical protein
MNGVEMLCLCGLKSIQDTLKLYLTLGPLRKEENSGELFSFWLPSYQHPASGNRCNLKLYLTSEPVRK